MKLIESKLVKVFQKRVFSKMTKIIFFFFETLNMLFMQRKENPIEAENKSEKMLMERRYVI